MKITRTEFRAVGHEVGDEIREMTSVPGWLGETMRQNCDACRFPISERESLQAIRCTSGNVLLIHAECLPRLVGANTRTDAPTGRVE